MYRKLGYLILVMALTNILARAQTPAGAETRAATAPTDLDMYCAGVVTTQTVPQDTYVISGVESEDRVVYHTSDYVFINKGANQGVKVGDQFLVSRTESELLRQPWFAWQEQLTRAMGTTYVDLGILKVTTVEAKTSIAEVEQACDYVQRGDIVQPFTPRPAPPYKTDTKFDPFAPPSGKAKAMVVTTKYFGQLAGQGKVVYVNLGSRQGVKVGDYFRMFRYQGEHSEVAYQVPATAYSMYGFGATPRPYSWAELPRDVVGEGIVLRVGPNAASVLITASQREIYVGDYVELE